MATALDFPPNTAFPSGPIVGQKHPQPPVSGQPVYTWDGFKWTTFGGTLDSGGAASALPLVDADTALVGLSTKYAREDHVHPKFATAQVDALAYNGMQINGGMDVTQERAINSVTTTAGFVCDGWQYLNNSPTLEQTIGTNTGYTPSGFISSIASSTTRTAFLSGSDFVVLTQVIEGWRMQRLGWGTAAAKPITIGFWTAHHRPGVYSVVAHPSDGSKSFVTTYTQASQDGWEYHVVTINGDTAGTWPYMYNGSIKLFWTIQTSPDIKTGTVNVWNAGGFLAAPNQVDGAGSTSDVFRLTGVSMQPGVVQLDAARSPLTMRPYGQELVTCQRYYRKYQSMLLSGYGTAGSTIFNSLPTGQTMRVAPTATVTSPTYSNMSGLAVNATGTDVVRTTSTISVTGHGYTAFDLTLDARI